MKGKIFLILCLFLCAAVLPAFTDEIEEKEDAQSDKFTVRIGIVNDVSNVELVAKEGSWEITDINGKVKETIAQNTQFSISLSDSAKKPQTYYRLCFLKTTEIDDAVVKAEMLKQKYGEDNIFFTHKLDNIDNPETTLDKNRLWYVCYGEFTSREAAEKENKKLSADSIIEDRSNIGVGEFTIKFAGETPKTFVMKNVFKIRPAHETAKITIKNVPYGGLILSRSKETRTYDGELEVYVDNSAKIGITNELDLEDYLCGVVPSEIGDDAPDEAFKAQAVCARSETLAKIAKHHHKNNNFDLCADVHCQVYAGITKKVPKCCKAVKECAGEVLTYKGQIIEAVYFDNSGGHTENTEDIWPGKPQPFLTGILDVENPDKYSKFESLKDEDVFKEWIEDPPASIYCNRDQKGMPNWAKKNFRWTKSYTGDDLESIINKKEKVGKIKDIKLGSRGVGGRLKSLTIIGDKKTITVYKELNIRITLGNLNSAAFRIKSIEKSGDFIESLVLQGAGSGHGVGLCQMGTRVRAVKGQSYKQILKAYFKGTTIKNIYSSKEE